MRLTPDEHAALERQRRIKSGETQHAVYGMDEKADLQMFVDENLLIELALREHPASMDCTDCHESMRMVKGVWKCEACGRGVDA